MVSRPQTPRKALHERSDSQTNASPLAPAAVRLVPYTPPRLTEGRNNNKNNNNNEASTGDNKINSSNNNNSTGTYLDYSNLASTSNNVGIYSRTALPTSPAHVLPPPTSRDFKASAQAVEQEGHSQGYHDSVKPLDDDVSPYRSPAAKPRPTPGPANSIRTLQNKVSLSNLRQPRPSNEVASSSSASKAKPLLKTKKHLAVDPTSKTFKITDFLRPVAKSAEQDSALEEKSVRQRSPAQAPTIGIPLHEPEEPSLDEDDIDKVIDSTASCVEDSTITTSDIAISTPLRKSAIFEDHIASDSPSDEDLVGGLRIVPQTPDVEHKAVGPFDSLSPSTAFSPNTVSDFSETTGADHNLSEQPSFESDNTESTFPANTNYQVHGSSPDSARFSRFSRPDIPPRTSSASPSRPKSRVPADPPVSDDLSELSDFISTPASKANYEIYGDPSPAPSSVALVAPEPNFITYDQTVEPKYSQESLVVAPLHSHRTRPSESSSFRYRPSTDTYRTYKTRGSEDRVRHHKSRETLRTRSASLASSIGTVLSSREAKQAIRHKSSIIHLPALKTPIIWAAGTGPLAASRALMQAHPHQWSSQLSTVASESEGSRRGSRSLSQTLSEIQTRSSGIISPISERHRLQSLSSIEGLAYAHSLERPRPAYGRTNTGDWDGDDEDEEGDVLEDMPNTLRMQRSRRRLSEVYNSSNSDSGRTNTMRSTASSRSRTSVLVRTIPEWARVYYGSGERKYLGAPGSSTEGDSRPQSMWSRSGSPDTSNFPLSIYSPRRRPRNGRGHGQSGSSATNASYRPYTSDSMAIRPVPAAGGDIRPQHTWTTRIRSRTSSIWSPHLRLDRRAETQSAWVPPSVVWSEESGMGGVRNRQVIMFILGFLFPFSWMIASFLPIPADPRAKLIEKEGRKESNGSSSDEELNAGIEAQTLRDPAGNEYQVGVYESDYRVQLPAVPYSLQDEKRFHSARWWRKLNRYMSIIGVLVLGTVVALIVVGIRQGWTK